MCTVFPKIKPFTFGDTPIFAGQSAQVACSVLEGDSPLELSWNFDGPRDVFGLGVSVVKIGTKTSLLSIDNTDSIHRGNYTCNVMNRVGNASYTARLNVHGIQLIVHELPLIKHDVPNDHIKLIEYLYIALQCPFSYNFSLNI